MKKRIFILLTIFLFSLTIFCQLPSSYVTIDPDGYANIRAKPSINSEILGFVNKYQSFSDTGQSCYDGDLDLVELAGNWLPVVISETPVFTVGYIYKKYIKKIKEFEEVEIHIKDSLHCSFSNDDIKLSISFSEPGTEKYTKSQEELSEWIIATYEAAYSIKEIIFIYKGQEFTVPKENLVGPFFLNNILEEIKGYNPGPYSLFKAIEGIYYLSMQGGDGGESWSALWVFDKGKLVNTEMGFGSCTVPDLKLNHQ